MTGEKKLFGGGEDFHGLMAEAIESLPQRHLESIGYHFIAVVLDEQLITTQTLHFDLTRDSFILPSWQVLQFLASVLV